MQNCVFFSQDYHKNKGCITVYIMFEYKFRVASRPPQPIFFHQNCPFQTFRFILYLYNKKAKKVYFYFLSTEGAGGGGQSLADMSAKKLGFFTLSLTWQIKKWKRGIFTLKVYGLPTVSFEMPDNEIFRYWKGSGCQSLPPHPIPLFADLSANSSDYFFFDLPCWLKGRLIIHQTITIQHLEFNKV